MYFNILTMNILYFLLAYNGCICAYVCVCVLLYVYIFNMLIVILFWTLLKFLDYRYCFSFISFYFI